MTDPIPPELISMPEDILRIILEKCDFVSIQRLRNTCHTFRDFIDIQKPKYHFKFFKIDGNHIEMTLTFSEKDENEKLYPIGQKIVVTYENIDGENTKIYWIRENKECSRIIENFNYFDLLSRDARSILSRNSAIMDKMSINLHIYENREMHYQKVFESCRTTPIKVRELRILNATCQEDVMQILPYTCPDTLKILEVSDRDGRNVWDISRILQLDHWSQIEELDMRSISVQAGIQNYDHFENAHVQFDDMTLEDVIRVKENFLNTPSITKHLNISFRNLLTEDRLVESFAELFGQPFVQPYRRDVPKNSWFFRRPDDYVLFIKFQGGLSYKIKTLTHVPEGARVIGRIHF